LHLIGFEQSARNGVYQRAAKRFSRPPAVGKGEREVSDAMNRRIFLKTMSLLGAQHLLTGMIPGGAPSAAAEEDGIGSHAVKTSLGLREIAEARLHHGGGRFLNPFSTRDFGNMWRLLRWKLFSENNFRPFYAEQPVRPVTIPWRRIRKEGRLSITFLKHAGVLIQDMGQVLVLDPVFFQIVRFIKDYTPFTFDLHEMPVPDHVLITHGHRDHLDMRSLAVLPQDVHVLSPLGYEDVFRKLGMAHRTRMDWYDSFEDSKRRIVLLPCNHWTMRNPFRGPNRSLWGSYWIQTAAGPTLFFSGDAAYFHGYRELGAEFPSDLAVFNLGAYEPRWFMGASHMNPAETVHAFQELRAGRLMVVHWGTFRLGDEPVHFPPGEIRREMSAAHLSHRLVHLDHGQTLFLNRDGSPDTII